jgi:hypothetical protein
VFARLRESHALELQQKLEVVPSVWTDYPGL